MTLNEILARIKQVVTAHKMVRSYDQQGLEPEFYNGHTNKYPAVNVMVQPGFISTTRKATSYGFIVTFEDQVHTISDTKTNEWDVVSDMAGMAEDISAQLNSPLFGDWIFSGDNVLNFLFDKENDTVAGVQLTFSISTTFTADRCQVPSSEIITIENSNDIKVYDVEYIANGTEGTTLDSEAAGSSLNVIKGKKVLAFIRESAPLHKVSNLPESAEYSWDNLVITLGTEVNQPIGGKGERFLILYRNY